MAAETLLPLQIAISSCLLGQAVRYDGGDKLNPYIRNTLGRYFDFVPICPEVGIGLGVPRPALQLDVIAGAVRVRGVENPAEDVTDLLRACAEHLAPRLSGCSGYIFKDRSPSCGLGDVPLHDGQGGVVGHGDGAFAAGVRSLLPGLPLIGERQLMDPHQRTCFFDQVFVYRRWCEAGGDGMRPRDLVAFHRRHKFLIQAHDELAYRRLGRLVAGGGVEAGWQAGYRGELMQALATPTTPGRHVNVLQHLLGFFKRQLPGADKAQLLAVIEAYGAGRLPLEVPLALLRASLQRFPHPYLAEQYYLNPHPYEGILRNGV